MFKPNSVRRNGNTRSNPVEGAKQELVAAVSQAIAKSEKRKCDRDRMISLNQSGHLREWMRQAESKDGLAYATMKAVRQAEKLCGRRLCLRINHALILSSRGFRFVSKNIPLQPHIFCMTGDVQRISAWRIRHRLDPNFRQQDIKQDVKNVLNRLRLNPQLALHGGRRMAACRSNRFFTDGGSHRYAVIYYCMLDLTTS